MKLYYSPGSCSTSCHITLEESGLKYELVKIDWDNQSDPNLSEVLQLNPLGTLPVMKTNHGTVLSQNLAIHTHIADQVPERKLLPKIGTDERAMAMNWLSFVAADLHKSFAPMFGLSAFEKKEVQNEIRIRTVQSINNNLAYLNKNLDGKEYLNGSNFSVADAYCFVVANWTKWLEIPIEPYANIQKYLERIFDRPAVQKVLKEEGLVQ